MLHIVSYFIYAWHFLIIHSTKKSCHKNLIFKKVSDQWILKIFLTLLVRSKFNSPGICKNNILQNESDLLFYMYNLSFWRQTKFQSSYSKFWVKTQNNFFFVTAFMIMIVLTIIRLANNGGQGHPTVANFEGIPNLFGVCVYSFMCHHSLPSLVTPIKNKSKLFIMVFIDFVLILLFYALMSFTGAFAFHQPKDIYTLSFLPDPCDVKQPITNLAVLQYYLALFPVFTLSTSFPIISITLRNNLKTMFYREERPFSWWVDRIVFPLAAIFLPIVIALATDEVEFLVGITGSYAGAGIQYVIPAALVLVSRRSVKADPSISSLNNRFTSPFKHTFWVILVFVWSFLAISFVTVNHILTNK